MGYARAGYQVVGVDVVDQPRYPFDFVQGDALEFVRRHGHRFHLIHASPPCQRFTAYGRRPGVGESYPDLIAPVREALEATGVPWIIENVKGAPLIDPVTLCGSMFGLDVRRHRLFETSFGVPQPKCRHHEQNGHFPAASNRAVRRTCEIGAWRIPLPIQKAAMGGCEWMDRDGLTEAIPPAYTHFLGEIAIHETL